jgi:hypothetical protein
MTKLGGGLIVHFGFVNNTWQKPKIIVLNKSNYITSIMKKFQMDTCNLVTTLLKVEIKLSKK